MAGHTILAQADITGFWRPQPRNQDGSGMIGDYAGVPVSAAGRWRAESWSPDDYDLAEYACRPHAWDYSLEGPLSQMRVWSDVDRATQKVIAYHGHLNQQEQETTIWMDGRPHPPANALHTWSGFTTGEWEGDVLVTTTTHLKETYIRRSGLMRSDRSIVRTRWRRIGDYLQATSILYDPVLMAEPYIRTTMTWIEDPDARRGAVSVRRGDGGRRAARGSAALPSRAEPAAWLESEADGSLRHAVRGKTWRFGNDVSRVHRQDENVPAPRGAEVAAIWAAEVAEEIEATSSSSRVTPR